MKNLLQTILQRYTAETPEWFRNIGYLAAVVAVVCGAILAEDIPLPEYSFLNLPLETWIDKIGMAASAVAIIAFGAKKDNSPENQNQ